MIKAVIFDFFGVLYGSSFKNIYSSMGGDTAADYAYIKGHLNQNNAGHTSPDQFEKIVSEKLGITHDEFTEMLKKVEQPNFELFEYIKTELKPKYKLAIISNAGIGTLQGKVPESLLNIFDVVTVSGEIGVMKPDPKIFTYTIDKLCVEPSEAVFTDDLGYFVTAAEELGMKGIHFQNFNQFQEDFKQIISK